MESTMTDDGHYKVWRLPDGTLHRENGPAVIWAYGRREWYIEGHLHRLDGPAVIWAYGRREWRINGWLVNEQIYKWADIMSIDLDNLTDYDKNLIAMKWTDYGK